MTDVVPAPTRAAAVPDGLAPAAERFARLTLRKSPQTQRTYLSTYQRFGAFLTERVRAAAIAAELPPPDEAPVSAFDADAMAAYFDAREAAGVAAATMKKDRAALSRLAKYLHTLGAIDATELLMVEVGAEREAEVRRRDALDEVTWQRVKMVARQRFHQPPAGRSSREAAARDLAMLLLLGDMGLRSEEVRGLRRDAIKPKRIDGQRPWLHVLGKGRKKRELPIPTEVEIALAQWTDLRDRLFDAHQPLMFPRLGRRGADGSFPDADRPDPSAVELADRKPRPLSSRALRDVVAPLMLTAGVEQPHAHPHVLRHTYGTLYMRRPRARLEDLRVLLGHESIETTSVYLHARAQDVEAAVLDNQAHLGDVLRARAAQRERGRASA
jgi:site-specific recombinase XerC